MSKATVI